MRVLPKEALGAIGESVASAQTIVSALPSAGRFGYADEPESAPFASWPEFLSDSLFQSRDRLSGAGLFSPGFANRVENLLDEVRRQAEQIHATPFLHDTTTKNVMVGADGRFSGIVDVDDLCWGDPRFVCALTLAVIQTFGGPRCYVAAWMRLARFADDRLFRTYVALVTLGLLSEQGIIFNGNAARRSAEERARMLLSLEKALEAAAG